MVILCSWHVLSRDNLERVRRDEAEAKKQEEEKAKRAALAVRYTTTLSTTSTSFY